jgi:hypothetical protein
MLLPVTEGTMSIGEFEISKGFERGFATSVVQEILDNGAGYASGPERGLLSALLFDGVQSFISFILAETPTEKARYSEAYSWVMDNGNESVFSFVNTCEALGINPEYLRLGLINASSSLLATVSKSRRNS